MLKVLQVVPLRVNAINIILSNYVLALIGRLSFINMILDRPNANLILVHMY